MAFPILTTDDLPEVEASLEHLAIDFKLEADPADRAVLATDMAAFANALGGTILVGGKAPGCPRDQLCGVRSAATAK